MGHAVYQRENSPKLVNGMLYIGKYIFKFLSLTSISLSSFALPELRDGESSQEPNCQVTKSEAVYCYP